MGQVINPSTVPSISVAGQVRTDIGNLIVLYAVTNNATNRYSSWRKATGSAGYTPSGTKKFVAFAIWGWSNSGASIVTATVGSCDNDVGVSSTTVPTNPVYLGGSSGFTAAVFANSVTVDVAAKPCTLEIPNAKFGFFDNGGVASSTTVVLFGYEA